MKEPVTTIQLKKSVVKALNTVKKYPRETYSEIITDLINFVKSSRMSKEYEEFISAAQEQKMKELWGNKEDEVW
jgi:hypothetical protein